MAVLAAWSATIVTLVSMFGRFNWFAELFTHFRLQVAIGAILVSALSVIIRMYRHAIALAIVALVNVAFLAGYVLPVSGDKQLVPSTLRLLSINVSRRTMEFTAFHDLINEERPDVIGLIEVDKHWIESLHRFESEYPYRILRPQDGFFGLAILSRVPVRELAQSPMVFEGIQTAIVSELDIGEEAVSLVLAHLMAPLTPDRARSRNRQLESLAGLFRQSVHTEGILVGDLNITPWSPHYASLESGTGLESAARGKGYRGTWPVQPFVLRIPIDHCLLTAGFQVQGFRTGPDIGSDHLSLIVDIAIARNVHRVNSAE